MTSSLEVKSRPTNAHEGRIGVLIKWGELKHLEALLNGIVHLNTPEFYRMRPADAFGDPHESCAYSHRKARDETPPTLIIDGRQVDGFVDLTIYNGLSRESYLHSWTALTLPADSEELWRMKRDFLRMRDEFGPNYASLPADRMNQFIQLAAKADARKPVARLVRYSQEPTDWDSLCKDSRYSFQREFRFLVGPCMPSASTPKKLFLGDLSELMSINADLGVLYEGQHILRMQGKRIW